METIPIQIDSEEAFTVEALNGKSIEFAVICKSENVYFLDRQSQHRFIGKLSFPLEYSKEYFTYAELTGEKKPFLQVHSYGNYVSITQKHGLNGIVFDLENSAFTKELQRGNYQVEHCRFPIAFVSKGNSTYLIHGTDWNRLDITDLESDKLLTERVVDYETSSNYFDYFHSSLSVSPDSKYFVSNGWHWGPCDVITAYSIDEFLSRFELAHISLNYGVVDGYNWDRPLCWVDNRIVAIGYNRQEDGESIGSFPSEIILVDVVLNEITNRIPFNGFALSDHGAAEGELFYDKEKQWFIGLNSKAGLLVSDINGMRVLSDTSFTSHKYSPHNRILYRVDDRGSSVEVFNIG